MMVGFEYQCHKAQSRKVYQAFTQFDRLVHLLSFRKILINAIRDRNQRIRYYPISGENNFIYICNR